MIQLLLCEHRLELITRAVKAYKPAADEKADHKDLVDYLTERAGEGADWEDLLPEDIPF